jgi:copper(I)-binding protein
MVKSLSGKAGTKFLFTPNIIHRGTVPNPSSDPRTAIFMFIRPTKRKINNLISIAKPKKANVNVKKYNLD